MTLANAWCWSVAVGAAMVQSSPGVALAQSFQSFQSLPTQHACDELGDKGWRTVPTLETVAQSDSAPYRTEPGGSWFVDRTTTVLPFCNYYNTVGNYSLRSYSLSPEESAQRIEICRAGSAGTSVAVAPYAGQCPPG